MRLHQDFDLDQDQSLTISFPQYNIVKLQVQSQVQVKVLAKVQCPVHGLGSGLNSGTQNSVSNSQKRGPGVTL